MIEPPLSPAQRDLLRTLPDRISPDRIDRLWLFAPRVTKARESGLLVLSLLPEGGDRQDQRTLLTLRYQAQTARGEVQRQDAIEEAGRAPPERIDRVIAGVLARDAHEASEPLVVTIDGRKERWAELLESLQPEA